MAPIRLDLVFTAEMAYAEGPRREKNPADCGGVFEPNRSYFAFAVFFWLAFRGLLADFLGALPFLLALGLAWGFWG